MFGERVGRNYSGVDMCCCFNSGKTRYYHINLNDKSGLSERRSLCFLSCLIIVVNVGRFELHKFKSIPVHITYK